MYHIINEYADSIVSSISSGHVYDYDWLLTNINHIGDSDYRRKYKVFWRLNTARLSDSFCEHYFELLEEALSSNLNIKEVTERLYRKQTHNGRKSLQFSFASKLLHMADPKLPIYDSMISAFYFYNEPKRTKAAKERITELAGFHAFLTDEYGRIISDGLLSPAIKQFRKKLQPKTFTDQKVVDSLLWAFVSMQKDNGLGTKKMLYC